ncbi:MAG: SDR family oxidoreductase [Thaumarchaeota archaeon]|nr:SDR family oxidoreductase [Nitrososphaerota archaeon]
MDSGSMAGKVCMVTGASSGIGRATAEKLALLGATVILVCRDRAKGEKTVTHIRQKGAIGPMELLLADFSSLQSVRELARAYLKSHGTLHVLVNNAGMAKLTRSVTMDGFETTLQVDYLSQFLLTNLLLGVLKKSAPSRIVFVSSVAHYDGRIDLDDLQMAEGYSVMKAYSRAKLAQVLFSCELAERLKGTGVTANCLHPGAVATNIWGRPLGRLSFLAKVTRLFLISPEEGAESPVLLASSPDLEGVTGKYFDRKREKRPAAASYDRALARRLWDTSANLVGLA